MNQDLYSYLMGNNSTPQSTGGLSSYGNYGSVWGGGLAFQPNPWANKGPNATGGESSWSKDWFGDKGAFTGLVSGLQGLGSLYMGFQGLKNAKKQQKFANEATRYQLNASTQSYNDKINQRSLSHASSMGLQGQAKDDFVKKENNQSQLSSFKG